MIEAGVDISARVLVTELAPWPNLVQRFGRAARWAGAAEVVVADLELKKTAPYEADALQAAREALAQVADVAPLYLEQFEEKRLALRREKEIKRMKSRSYIERLIHAEGRPDLQSN